MSEDVKVMLACWFCSWFICPPFAIAITVIVPILWGLFLLYVKLTD